LLDGDNIRRGLSKDLGFTDNDRVENIRRIAEVAKLMIDAGLVVIVSFISPFSSDRSMARNLNANREFIEIYIDASLDLCISRDPKGLYKKAQNGEIKNFTGIDSSYDIPQDPEIRINSDNTNANDAADQILSYLGQNNYLKY
jgi:adenylyl-sulfate kinase